MTCAQGELPTMRTHVLVRNYCWLVPEHEQNADGGSAARWSGSPSRC